MPNAYSHTIKIEEVAETEGECQKCHEQALLGNGLCSVCFDKRIDREYNWGHRVGLKRTINRRKANDRAKRK